MNGFFITGTDTNVGKTLASAVLTLALRGHYWKPIQTGVADEMADAHKVREWTGLPPQHILPSRYLFQASLAPDQASALEETPIHLSSCTKPNVHSLIIEGAGGVFVPINASHCMMDLMAEVALPIIIVTRGSLGTINHTLLTIAALRQRALPIHGILFSGEWHAANQAAIEHWSGVRTLFRIPLFPTVNATVLHDFVTQHHQQIMEFLR